MRAAALRLLETPEGVEVEQGDGRPCAVWWRGRRIALDAVTGPELLAGDWWRDDGYRRDYWRCEGDDGAELLVYAERGAWYVQGWYD